MPLHSFNAGLRGTSKRPGNTLVGQAPAKVNLFLEVLNKRPDGYHDIATLMVAVTLFDVLRFKEEKSGDIRLTCSNPELSTGPENLVFRAADLLKRHTGCKKGVTIRLTKRIPLAAGLAGGSSDAAATCIGLNRLWNLGLSRKELLALGAELGSDVSFFFAPPAAWCTCAAAIRAWSRPTGENGRQHRVAASACCMAAISLPTRREARSETSREITKRVAAPASTTATALFITPLRPGRRNPPR